MAQPQSVKPKKYDVMLTHGCRIPGEDGEMENAGPTKRGGEAVRVSVTRRLGNQIVQANRGYWADGKPAAEATTDEPTETAAKGPARGRGGKPK